MGMLQQAPQIDTPNNEKHSVRSVVKRPSWIVLTATHLFGAPITSKVYASIRGTYHIEGVVRFSDDYTPSAFCHNCGKAFPWTERKIASAVELVEVGADLSPEEMQQFRSDLTELTKDSPKTQVASLRFKKVMGKAGKSIASGVRDIVVDVLSESAKKAIWG